VHWVFIGYTFSFGWHSRGWGDGSWVGLRHVGEEPNFDYAGTISHQNFVIFQMTFAVRTINLQKKIYSQQALKSSLDYNSCDHVGSVG
jgi:Amt family ammonium transporter